MFAAAASAVSLTPSVAFGHTERVGGFTEGLAHPVLGFDHLLAMLSVGILSAQIGGRAIWTVPAAFVGVMVLGGILGMQDTPLPAVEDAIRLSVVALGVSLAAERKLPQLWAMFFVAFFAFFHGHAHGTEMPHVAKPVLYALGFVIGTAGIHVAGVLVGEISRRTARGPRLLRFVGAGIAGAGVHMLISG